MSASARSNSGRVRREVFRGGEQRGEIAQAFRRAGITETAAPVLARREHPLEEVHVVGAVAGEGKQSGMNHAARAVPDSMAAAPPR